MAARWIGPAHHEAIDGITHVVVMKGEGLARSVVEDLKRRLPHAHFALYMWDALDNARNALRTLDLFDYVGTFDPVDAARHDVRFRPLFADIPAEMEPAGNSLRLELRRHDPFGSLAGHSQATRGLPSTMTSFVFGYLPSNALRMRYLLRSSLTVDDAPVRLSTRPMQPADVLDVTAASRAVLDIEHPSQVGLTMRTIEVLLMGRKIMTTNARIRETPLFHPSRVHIIDRRAPKVPGEFFDSPFEALPDALQRHYSIDTWAAEVLGL